MIADDLRRGLPHRRADRRAARRADRGGRRRRPSRRRRALPRGRAGRPPVDPARGQHRAVRAQRQPRRSSLATMSTPGQWAGGLTRLGRRGSGAGYRATGRAVHATAACSACRRDDLGRLVGEWFPFGKHMVVGVFQTVRSIEATARQRESLVALGTLAAGLAHEINNPAAASLRAVDELADTCDTMLSSLVTLAEHAITAEQFVELDRLRRELGWTGRAPTTPSRRWTARSSSATGWRTTTSKHAWQIAPLLAVRRRRPGVVRRTARRSSVATALGPAMRVGGVDHDRALRRCSSELTDTTKRISHLVEAVKSYSQIDRAVAADARHPRRHREHARHAAPQAGAASTVERIVRPDSRRSRCTPPS